MKGLVLRLVVGGLLATALLAYDAHVQRRRASTETKTATDTCNVDGSYIHVHGYPGCGERVDDPPQYGIWDGESLPTTQTIGQACRVTQLSGDPKDKDVITYLKNDKICATMYRVDRHDETNGWYYVDIIGAKTGALFKSDEEALAWARSMPYVRRKEQVR